MQEADAYLHESDLFKSTVKPLPTRPGLRQPNAASDCDNADRRIREKFTSPKNMLRAKRERNARSNYAKKKGVVDVPKPFFGTTLRDR